MRFNNWRDIDPDPTKQEIVNWRRERLFEALGKENVKSREVYLTERVANCDVLDIGVVEHVAEASKSEKWLHRQLAGSAKSILGVDILAGEIEKLKSNGFNVICHDVLNEPLTTTYDLIVCGELVEHLGCPEKLFFSAEKMLRPGGSLLLTTPNPWYANTILENLVSRKPFVDNVDHVSWYDASTLAELAERNSLQLSAFRGIQSVTINTLTGKIFYAMLRLAAKSGLNPHVLCKSIIYEFRKP